MWKWLPVPIRRLFDGIVDRATPLSWLLFLLGAVLVVPALYGLVGAHYHPNAFYAPYAPLFALTVIVYGGVSFLFGSALFLFRRSEARRPMATAFAIITFTLPVTAIAIAAIPRPVPDSFLQYAGYDAYRVPSVFTQRHGDGEPGEGASVNVVYCDNNWSGYYSRLLADCRRASLSLSKRKITRTFDARYTLDRIWKIPREGDIITDLAALAEETDIVEGDGWTGYTASVGSRIAHAVLDSDNRLVLFGRCVPRGTLCFMVSQTPAGLLTFMHRDGSDFDYQRWKMQEAEILELLAAWREID